MDVRPQIPLQALAYLWCWHWGFSYGTRMKLLSEAQGAETVTGLPPGCDGGQGALSDCKVKFPTGDAGQRLLVPTSSKPCLYEKTPLILAFCMCPSP